MSEFFKIKSFIKMYFFEIKKKIINITNEYSSK